MNVAILHLQSVALVIYQFAVIAKIHTFVIHLKNELSLIYVFVVGLGQKTRRVEMAPQIDAKLVSPDTMTKRG